MQSGNSKSESTEVQTEQRLAQFSDPIVQILLRGDAETVRDAEEKYLEANLRQVIELVNSPLSDEEFRSHPLIALLLSHGSRDWEDATL